MAEELFVSFQITPRGEYTHRIEGPSVDSSGVLYACNFARDGTIGKLMPGANASAHFVTLPPGCIANGSRFDGRGRMFVADFKKHNIFVLDPGASELRTYFHDSSFTQPNDLSVSSDGIIYASDPSFSHGSGRIWRVVRSEDGRVRGAPMVSERAMGVTNGLDLSPDESSLYVSESNTRQIWMYKINGDHLMSPHLLMTFPDFELDGLRTDSSSRVFVARPGNGTVAITSPTGALLREVRLNGKDPTNLTFGGPDGKTVYVTQGDGGFIEAFRVDVPGRT